MRKLALCILVIVLTCAAPVTSQAGFVVKKHAAFHATNTVALKTALNQSKAAATAAEFKSMVQEYKSPSGVFVGWMYRGVIAKIAFVCGLLGFWAPFFAIAAMMLGFIGITRRQMRHKGLAVAAIVLGLAAIIISAAGGFAPLPIF